MINETTANGFDNLLQDVCLKTDIEGMDDSVLKIALKHYLRGDGISHQNHKDRCICFIGGL
jgi:hypothetical protein